MYGNAIVQVMGYWTDDLTFICKRCADKLPTSPDAMGSGLVPIWRETAKEWSENALRAYHCDTCDRPMEQLLAGM